MPLVDLGSNAQRNPAKTGVRNDAPGTRLHVAGPVYSLKLIRVAKIDSVRPLSSCWA
jgi:hypothetical protein